jgi:flagellar hook assembly protein FlgD
MIKIVSQNLTVILITILLSVFTNTIVFAEAPPSLSITFESDDECEASITGDETVITLIDDVEKSAGDHDFDWDGTNTAGDTVESGTYEYKIIAKDIDSGDELDTEKGTITITDEESSSNACADPITDDEADPVGFNPGQGEETEVKFTLNCSVLIELNILDSDDEIVVTLIDNVEKSATDHSLPWYGTANNSSSGESVESGTYQYQIIAKDIDSDEELETEEGDINVIVIEEDPPEEDPPEEDPPEEDPPDDEATEVLQNTDDGTTSETGPGILIYGIFPVLGVLYNRKKRRRN